MPPPPRRAMCPARNRRRLNWPVPIARRGRGSAEVDLKTTFSYNIHGRKTCHNEKRKSFNSSILVRLSYKILFPIDEWSSTPHQGGALNDTLRQLRMVLWVVGVSLPSSSSRILRYHFSLPSSGGWTEGRSIFFFYYVILDSSVVHSSVVRACVLLDYNGPLCPLF